MSRRMAARFGVLATAFLLFSAPASAATSAAWPTAGHDLQNTRFASTETTIGVGNASTLSPKWTLTTTGDVSATPSTDGSTVYFPDWGGSLWAVAASTGKVAWQRRSAVGASLPRSLSPWPPWRRQSRRRPRYRARFGTSSVKRHT